MIDIKLGERYEISELRMAGYTPVVSGRLKDSRLIEKFGSEVIKYKRGNESCLVVGDSGLLKVIARYNPDKGKGTEIFRGK